ncbi:MAG: hydantoinase B/oxoprolinase family protein [Paracoccaceae bacterium]|nr:hydantoinase B/oxoprolinase family protein [Paracoccaceae bacterium]
MKLDPEMATARGAASAHDPITLEILLNAVGSATDEAFAALMKAAHSTNIKERNDHSTAIFDPAGRLVVQAARSLPVHIGSITGAVLGAIARYGDRMAEGDVFIANDPYTAQGSHLPDVNMVMPVFADGALIGFSCNVAHHADIGGMSPGSMAGGMTELHQEGVRVPVVRLIEGGRWNTELFEMLLLNVRGAAERRGDYFAQLAACNLQSKRLVEIVSRYGAAYVQSAFDDILRRTERRIRDGFAAIPDGRYAFEDVMDDDGVEARDIPIRLAIEKSGDRIFFDFAGSSPQVPGNINLTMNATVASVCFALKALLDPDAPNNQGVIAAVDVEASEGSIVNAVFPAAVAQRSQTCQRVVDIVIGCLAPCLPHRAVGASNGADTTAVFSGTDPRNGRSYVYVETLGGGVGGRADRDGKDGVQANLTNTSNLPVEAIELVYPLRVEEYALVPDSGGAGRSRGGMGIRRVIRPIGHACTFSGAGERFTTRPWGIFGGGSGATGGFAVANERGVAPLPTKPRGFAIPDGAAIVIETPGAGGYGPPAERDAESRAADARSGKLSSAYRARHYPEEADRDADPPAGRDPSREAVE